MGELPTPVLAVQATRFKGGVALGVTVHHGVADGRSLWTFVEAWATACRGETPAATPCFDRSLVRLPGGQELARSFLRKYAPNLPKAAYPAPLVEDHARLTRRTFTVDARGIQRLKERIVRLGESSGAAPVHLHRRRRARLDVLRPVQAVRLGRRRDGRLPRGCPPPPRPSRRRGILRRVPHRMHREPPRARAPRRARLGGRGAGGAGGGPQEDGGPDGRVRFPGTGVQDRHGTADERVGLVELPGLRAGGLRVGQADADGEHQDDPRRAGGADARQGRPGRAGVGLAARTGANGRVQVSVARVSRLNVGSTPPFIFNSHIKFI
ncbi:hypothetical protein ACQJBY_018573 [Aegilops geniculata]